MKAHQLALLVNKLPYGLALNRWLYRMAARMAVAYLSCDAVLAFYLRGSMVRGNYVPGLSDIDLHIVIKDLPAGEMASFLAGHQKRCNRAKRFFPPLNIYTDTIADLTIAGNAGWMYFLNPGDNWSLLSGKSVFPTFVHPSHQSLLGWAKLLYRRYFGIQKRTFGRDPFRKGRRAMKVNENLLIQVGKLLYFIEHRKLTADRVSLTELAGQVSNPFFSYFFELWRDVEKKHHEMSDEVRIYRKSFDQWHGLIKSIATKGSAADLLNPKIPAAKNWTLTELTLPPEAKGNVRARLAPLIDDLHRITAEEKIALVLSAVPNTNYNFKLYLVVPDDRPNIEELVQKVHESFWRLKATFPENYFFSFRSPLIVSESVFKNMAVSEKGALEPYYMKKHGEVVFNTLGRSLTEMDTTVCPPSFVSECMTHLRFVRRRRDLVPHVPSEFNASFVDYVTGTLPATRLFLENKLIVTTPAEAVREYEARFSGDYKTFVKNFHAAYAGADPARLNAQELTDCYRKNFDLLRSEAEIINKRYLELLQVTL